MNWNESAIENHLSIGLRVLTLIEHQVRQQLAELKQKISGDP